MYFEKLNDSQWKKIYKEYETNAEIVKKNADELMEWMEQEPHLPNVKDKDILTHFLLRCKNNVERTKQRLDLFYTSKSVMDDLFCEREECLPILYRQRLLTLTPLPKLTPEGHRVLIFNISAAECDCQPKAETTIKGLQMLSELCVKLDDSVQCVMIYDLKNLTLPLMTYMLPIMKRNALVATKLVPIRFHKFYILNLHPWVRPVLNIAKTLLPKKLAERVVIWTKENEDLAEEISINVLPSEYGGLEKPLQELNESWMKYFAQHHEWFIQQEHVKADLTKKSKSSKTKKLVTEV